MELLYLRTEPYETDLKRLNSKEQALIAERVNDCFSLLKSSRTRKRFYEHVEQPYRIELRRGYESSLYGFRVSDKITLIAAVDEDFVHNRILITCLRVFKDVDFQQAYQAAADLMYHDGMPRAIDWTED